MLQTDINDCEQSTSQKLKNDKTISIQKDTENTKNIIGEEKSRFSEIDKNQLMQLCRKIWETKGGIVGNKADNIPYQLTIRQEHADYYIRAVLAIFFETHRRNKKVFSRELFSKIFGFKEKKPNENPLRGLLQRKHKSNPEVFPKKETATTFLVPDLKADGHELKQNGIFLDVGGS